MTVCSESAADIDDREAHESFAKLQLSKVLEFLMRSTAVRKALTESNLGKPVRRFQNISATKFLGLEIPPPPFGASLRIHPR